MNGGAGALAAYGGASCGAPSLLQAMSSAGAATCYTTKLNDLANPNGDKSFNMVDNHLSFNWVQPVVGGGFDGAVEFQASGNFAGDLVHIHQFSGNPPAGTHLLHVEGADPDVIPIHIISGNVDAITTGQRISAGSFLGPLTGAVTGNASTASAFDHDPAACGANLFATDQSAAGVLTCVQPAFSNLSGSATAAQIPTASTTLGGVKMASACGAGNHISSIVAGELTCSADASGSGGSGNFLEVDVSFAAAGDTMSSTVVTGQAWVTSTSKIMCAPTMLATSTRNEGDEDAVIERLSAAVHSRVVGTGFTLTVAPSDGTASGVYKFHCSGG